MPSKRQLTLLYIRDYRAQYGMSPTEREISCHLYGHDRNGGNVNRHIIRPLIAAGYLYKAGSGKEARSLMLVQPQRDYDN